LASEFPHSSPSEDNSTTSETPAAADAKTYDPTAIAAEVNQKFSNWRSIKRPIETNWFIHSAMVRGVHNVKWNDALNTLESTKVPSHKQRPSINKILPKYRQRKAKFLKHRYVPLIVPASSDKEDKQNATASQLALEYVSRKNNLEKTYRQSVDDALTFGKGFIWVYWDDTKVGMVPGEMGPVENAVGDVCFESGSPFEILVPDIGVRSIGDQHELMRVRAIPLEELKLKHQSNPQVQELKGDSSADDLFQYQKQIATLSAKSQVGLASALSDKSDKDLNMIVRKELFTKPCGKYPKGRYVVTAGDIVLRYQEMLPYGFTSMSNPYPVVEFPDLELAGQFWPTSMVEQLIGPQREYAEGRQRIINHLNKQAHPKIICSIFHKFPENAWNDEAGEVIKILTPPNVAPPQVITPPAISQDQWRSLELIRQEMDEISGLPPVATGEAGTTTSGFQVNLLQEANDAVHAPDVRSHEMAFEELYQKARKIMAQGYVVPRLISIAGRAHIPDVVEFSQNNIDENSEIIVYTGSALANSPAVRTQQVIELWNAGILMDDMNPAEGKRRALSMLDTNGIGEFQEEKKRDEEKARLENLNIIKGQHVKPPLPFDDHIIHYTQHTDQMKSPEFDTLDEMTQKELFAHALLHMKFINPEQAIQTALELGMELLIPMLLPPQLPQPANPEAPPEGAEAPPPAPPVQ
jgi:hypothetical protein